jgi:fibronectin-binding autotransporter adhesin
MSRPGLPPLGIPSSKVSRLPWIATVVISTLLWLVAAGGTAVAANNTWSDTGGGFAWGQNGNWSGSVPTLADDLFFGSSFNSTTIDLDVTGLSNSLTITTGVSFTITPTGTQRLILNSGSLTRLTSASGSQTINSGVVLNNNGVWTINGSGTLTVNGNISGSTASTSLTKTGTGVLTLSGTNTFGGPLSINDGTLRIATINNGGVAGVTGTSSSAAANLVLGGGRLQFTGASGTTNRGFTLTNSTTSTIDVTSASGTLTFTGSTAATSGGLTKSGSGTLRLAGLGQYTGATTVSGGTLALGINNALSNSTAVSVNAAAFNTGLFSDTVASLTTSGNTTLLFSGSAGTAGSLTMGAFTLGAGTDTLNIAFTTAPTLSRYNLISYTSRSGTFDTTSITGATGYRLVYGGVGTGTVALAQNANQTFTATGGTPRVLVNTTMTVTGTLANSAASGAADLTVSLTGSGATFAGFNSSAGSVVAGAATSLITGSLTTSATAGTQTWRMVNADSLATTTTATATGSLQVVNQRTFILSTSTIGLGNVHVGAAISGGTVSITSGGLNATTASGTLGSFTGGPSGLTFGLTSGSTQFLGAASPQTTVYTLAGTAVTAGAISGTYTSIVAAELGSIPNITLAVNGNFYSGTSTWNTNGGGRWGRLSGTGANAFGINWGATQGSPGLDSGFTTTDTATFGSVLTGGTAQVFLGGATPSLKSLTFDNAAGSYEIYPSDGSGPIVMAASGTSALLSVLSGTHSMHSDIFLGASTVINIATGADFTFHTEISGSSAFSLTKSGAGTMNVIGNNSYAGNTFITGGSVVILSGTSGLGSGTVSLTNGSVLNLNFLPLGNVINTVSGTVLNAADSQSTVNVYGPTTFQNGPFTKGLINVFSGGTATFNNALGQTGTNSATLTVNMGGRAYVNAGIGLAGNLGVIAGGQAAIFGTSLGSITATGSGSSFGVLDFNGVHDGDIDIFSGGVINFAGNNLLDSTFNIAAGGFASVTGTIGGELHVSGTATIAGSVLSGADMIVEAGGRVTLLNTSSFAQALLSNSGRLIVDRTTNNLTLATEISGTGVLQKTGTGWLALTGSSSFTGGTQLDAGSLYVNGWLGSGVVAALNSTLGGSGYIGGPISGAGLVAPGSSPGILTAISLDAGAGTSFAFEFTGTGAPVWSSASSSGNDLLRLTDPASPLGTSLTAANAVNVYFDVATIAGWDTFQGAFFTDKSADFLASIENAAYSYYVKGDGNGTDTFYNNQGYYSLPAWAAANIYDYQGVTLATTSVASANFASGTVIEGQVTEFVVVPEPGALALAATGLAAGIGLVGLRRRRVASVRG